MFSTIKTCILISFMTLFIFGCDSNKQEDIDDPSNTDTKDIKLDSQKTSAQNVFNTIPGREKILSLLQKSQAEYNSSILNDPNNVSKYTLESSKALNLGSYGCDLNVTGIFEQTQESMLFLKCINILAKSLGVSTAFDEKMVDRMENNKQNRDSTLEIISQSFRVADNYLKANGRPGTSSLIVAGAWVEGFYTACHTAKETKSTDIVKEIFIQKESLTYLIQLLEYSRISEDSKYLITDLIDLKKIIDAKTDNVYTVNSLKEIDVKISEIRTKIISLK